MNPRTRTRLTVPALALGVALMFAGAGGAQSNPPAFQGTPAEMDAYRLYKENKLLTARTRAQAALDANADSVMGNYVMGVVMHEAEGILPRAMYFLGRARQGYEQRYGTNAPAGAPWQLHREILFAIQSLANQMEEYEYQLQILDFYNALYDPDLIAERAWPLARLGRFDEARVAAATAVASIDAWQSQLGRNMMCAIEGEAKVRPRQYQACIDALVDARRRAVGNTNTDPINGPRIAVHAFNAAQAAYAVLRFDEVERIAREGTNRLEFTVANPWRMLTRLYVDGARMTDAVAAAREMQRWRVRQPANLRDQDRAETDVALATMMLVAGEPELGLRLIHRAIERPDRRGLVTSNPEQALGAHALLRRALVRLEAELMRENASSGDTFRRNTSTIAASLRAVEAFPDDERILSTLADESRIDATFRMYVEGGIEPVPSWLVSDLIPVLGAGVVAVTLEEVRREEAAYPTMSPYYDGIEAEVALARGDNALALTLAQRSLLTLPQAENLLRARVAAVGGEAAWRDGNTTVALALFERAVLSDAGVLRRLGFSLPARLTHQANDAAAEEAADRIGRSPRLDTDVDGAAFQIAVDRLGPKLRVCIRSSMGALLGCTDAGATPNETPAQWGIRLAENFHTQLFTLRGGLATVDLRSLDGSNSAAREAAREQMRGLLDEMNRDSE